MVSETSRRLAAREREVLRDREARQAMWLFMWILFGFKIATVGVIWYAATATSSHELDFIIATTWYWLLIPIAAITGPLLFRLRLVRMRRRRRQLREAEWMEVPVLPNATRRSGGRAH